MLGTLCFTNIFLVENSLQHYGVFSTAKMSLLIFWGTDVFVN